MKKVPQSYYRTLPSPGLQTFVDDLPAGEFNSARLWRLWNFSAKFDDPCYEDQAVFRYALQKAGMKLVSRFKLRKD